MSIMIADLRASLTAEDHFSGALRMFDKGVRGSAESARAAAADVGRLGIALGGLAAGGLVAAVKAASDWQQTLIHIQSNTGLTNSEVGMLSRGVQQMAAQTGAPLNDLATGFMNIHNSGFSAAQSLLILQPAMQSALSTGDNVAEVANTLGTAMHEFHIQTSQAAQAMNVLHLAAQEGHSTLGQFVEGTTQAFNMAGSYKVSLTDVAAALSTLTQSGQTARMASQGLSSAFQGIIKPSAAAKDAILAIGGQKLADEFSAPGLAARGFANIMGDVKKAVDGAAMTPMLKQRLLADYAAQLEQAGVKGKTLAKDLTAMARNMNDPAQAINAMFANVRAAREVMILTGNQADSFATHLRDMGAAWSGLLDPTKSGFVAQQQTLAAQMAKLQANVQILAIAIGNVLLPPITQLAQRLVPVVQGLVQWAQQNPTFTRDIVVAGLAITGLGAALGAVMFVVGPLISVIGALGVPLLAIGAAAAALYVAWNSNFLGIRTVVQQAWRDIQPAIGGIRSVLGAISTDFQRGGLQKVVQDLPRIFGQFGPTIVRSLGTAGQDILHWIDLTRGRIGTQLGKWVGAFGTWVGPATEEFLKNWPKMLNSFLDRIGSAAGPVAAKFVTWFVKVLPDIVRALALLGAAIIAFMVETAGTLALKALAWGVAIVGWVAPQIPKLLNAMSDLIDKLMTWIGHTALPLITKAASQLGGDLMGGLVQGLKDHTPGFLSGIWNVISGGHEAAKKAAGTHSPSTVWMQIGRDMVAGLVQGLQQGHQGVASAASGVLNGAGSGGATRAGAQYQSNTAVSRAVEIHRQFLLILRQLADQYDRVLRPVQIFQVREQDLMRVGQYGVQVATYGTGLVLVNTYNPAMKDAALQTGKTVIQVHNMPPVLNATHTSIKNVSDLLVGKYNPAMKDAAQKTKDTTAQLVLLALQHPKPSAKLDISNVVTNLLHANRLLTAFADRTATATAGVGTMGNVLPPPPSTPGSGGGTGGGLHPSVTFIVDSFNKVSDTSTTIKDTFNTITNTYATNISNSFKNTSTYATTVMNAFKTINSYATTVNNAFKTSNTYSTTINNAFKTVNTYATSIKEAFSSVVNNVKTIRDTYVSSISTSFKSITTELTKIAALFQNIHVTVTGSSKGGSTTIKTTNIAGATITKFDPTYTYNNALRVTFDTMFIQNGHSLRVAFDPTYVKNNALKIVLDAGTTISTTINQSSITQIAQSISTAISTVINKQKTVNVNKGGTGGGGGGSGGPGVLIDIPNLPIHIYIPLADLGKIKDAILGTVSSWGGALAGAGANIGLSIIKGLTGLFSGIGEPSGTDKTIKGLLGAVGLGAKGLAGAASSLAGDFFGAVGGALAQVPQKLKDTLGTALNNFFVKGASGTTFSASSFAGMTTNATTGMIGALVQSFAAGTATLASDVTSFVQRGFGNFAQDVWNVLSGTVKGIASVKDEITHYFADAGSWLVQVGKDLIGGLAKGIGEAMTGGKNSLSWALSQIANFIPGWLKSLLGIHSPSTVMAGLGANLTQGLVVGMQSQQRTLGTQLTSMANQIRGMQTGATSPQLAARAPRSQQPVHLVVQLDSKVLFQATMNELYRDQRLRVSLGGAGGVLG